MTLRDWQENGWLKEHKTSPQEISGLLSVAGRDLKACQVPGLDTDWKLNIAYNAALQTAAAALAASGYRASRDNQHYRIIQSLAFTIEADSNLIVQFDQFRKKRNLDSYVLAGAVSAQEAEEMLALAALLRTKVVDWLKVNHPALLRN